MSLTMSEVSVSYGTLGLLNVRAGLLVSASIQTPGQGAPDTAHLAFAQLAQMDGQNVPHEVLKRLVALAKERGP